MGHERVREVGTARLAVDSRDGWPIYRQAVICLKRHEWDTALVLLAEAETAFRTRPDPDGEWRALIAQAVLHWRQGKPALAMARALAALGTAEQLRDSGACGAISWQAAIIALDQGDYAAAGLYLQRAQTWLDMAGTAPAGGVLAAAAQLCAEVLRWQNAAGRGQIGQQQALAAIADAGAELERLLASAAQAFQPYGASPHPGGTDPIIDPALPALPPPPELPERAAPLLSRLARWWRHLFGLEAAPSPPEQHPPAAAEPIGPPAEELAPEPAAAPEPHPLLAVPPEPATQPSTSPATIEPAPPAQPGTATGAPALTVYTFGRLRVYIGDALVERWEGARSRSLLRFLVTHRLTPPQKEQLAALFWPESEPELARRSLHQAIYCLRQTLKRYAGNIQIIQFVNDHYQIASEITIWVDADDFEAAVSAARAHLHAGDRAAADQAYGRAVDLYQGEYLVEERYDDWAIERRSALQAKYLEALHELARSSYQRGDYSTAMLFSQRALDHDSCDEDAHRTLISCYAAQGRRHMAVRQYQLCAAALKKQLGLEPSEEFEAFYRHIMVMDHHEAPDARDARVTVGQ